MPLHRTVKNGKYLEGADLTDRCPKCSTYSYQGGWCFGCNRYRPSKHNARQEDMDSFEFMQANFGRRIFFLLTESDEGDDT